MSSDYRIAISHMNGLACPSLMSGLKHVRLYSRISSELEHKSLSTAPPGPIVVASLSSMTPSCTEGSPVTLKSKRGKQNGDAAVSGRPQGSKSGLGGIKPLLHRCGVVAGPGWCCSIAICQAAIQVQIQRATASRISNSCFVARVLAKV